MNKEQNFYDWEDSFDLIENIEADVLVNGLLKITDFHFDKIDVYRNPSGLVSLVFYTKKSFLFDLTENEIKPYNYEIELKLKSPHFSKYNSIVLYDANSCLEKYSYVNDCVETKFTAQRTVYKSDREKCILKEWYGCNNKLNFYHGFSTSKTTEEKITYKNSNSISFVINSRQKTTSKSSFWVKLKDYKFKVTVIKSSNDDFEYHRYVLEYNKKWGLIPNEETRHDISNFLSFIIGAKLIKFGESYFSKEYITQKEYISPNPIDISLLYQSNFPFFIDDSRYNNTDLVIKQIPKMLRRFFLFKEKYRLNEVLPTLFVKSYLNFNFINYVTYIEMFANIDVDQKPTLITKIKFKEVLKNLNAVKNVPKSIKDKFQNLNLIGIGKKVQRLLSKYKIDYSRYKDVFSVRGKVVHGAYVDIEEMFIASQKAKELLTILTLKKLNYNGYIRNFINNEELILVKDMSIVKVSQVSSKCEE